MVAATNMQVFMPSGQDVAGPMKASVGPIEIIVSVAKGLAVRLFVSWRLCARPSDTLNAQRRLADFGRQ